MLTHISHSPPRRRASLVAQTVKNPQTQRSPEGPRHLHRIPRLSESWELPPRPGIMVLGGHQQMLAEPSKSLSGS